MEQTIALSKDNERKYKRKVNKTKDKIKKGQLVLKNNLNVLKKPKLRAGRNVKTPKIDVKPARIKKAKADRGVVYVGHIPHGFYEDQMSDFFKQFGAVTNCRVNRSAKTGTSKGFGYIEFKDPEVAKIAAETMNNYLMFKRRLITKYIPPTEQRVDIFRAPSWSNKNFPLKVARQDTIRVYNNNTYVDYKEECKGMMESVQIKLDKLKEMGITYDFKFNHIPDFISTSNETDAVMPSASEEEYSNVEDSDDPNVDLKVPQTNVKKNVRKSRKNR